MTTPAAASSSVGIREAVLADLLSVFRIEKACFPQPWPYSAFERYLDRPGFLVAEADGVVGYVVADCVPNGGRPLGHVKDIAVDPTRRNEGIATTLLDRVIGVLGAHEAASVKLEVREGNDAALSLYRRFEFHHRRTVPRYYANGDDAFVMVRELDG